MFGIYIESHPAEQNYIRFINSDFSEFYCSNANRILLWVCDTELEKTWSDLETHSKVTI